MGLSRIRYLESWVSLALDPTFGRERLLGWVRSFVAARLKDDKQKPCTLPPHPALSRRRGDYKLVALSKAKRLSRHEELPEKIIGLGTSDCFWEDFS